MAGRPHPRQAPAHRAFYDARNAEWVRMLHSGMSITDIAQETGEAYHAVKSAIRSAMDRARDELFTETESYRALNLERLGKLLHAVWPDAMTGNDKSVGEARRIIADISRLTGANEAVRIEIGESDVDRTLRELDELLNRRAAEAEVQTAGHPAEADAAEGAHG